MPFTPSDTQTKFENWVWILEARSENRYGKGHVLASTEMGQHSENWAAQPHQKYQRILLPLELSSRTSKDVGDK